MKTFFISIILLTIFYLLSPIFIIPIDYLIKTGDKFGSAAPIGILFVLFSICAGVVAALIE